MAKRRGRVSAYARFVGRQLKAGKTMKSAARAWKSGKSRTRRSSRVRPTLRRAGRKAARKAARRSGYKGKSAVSRYMGQVGRIGAARRLRRRRPSRLVWRGAKRVAANDYLSPLALNRGRRGRSRRSYRRNPAGFAVFKESFKDLLKLDTFMEAGQIVGGGLLSVALPNMLLQSKLGEKLPAIVKTGWGRALVNLAATGVASGAAGWFGKKKLARNFLIGGVAATVNAMAMTLLKKQASTAAAGSLTAKVAQAVGVSGMSALPSAVESAVDQAVAAELAKQGLRDMLPAGGMGDYLQPAGGMGDYLQPAGMSDYPEAGVEI